MATVFVAGSITIKCLDFKVQERLMNIISLGHDVLVGMLTVSIRPSSVSCMIKPTAMSRCFARAAPHATTLAIGTCIR